jgi:hypothetical protein
MAASSERVHGLPRAFAAAGRRALPRVERASHGESGALSQTENRMEKWEGTIYRNNHIKAACYHVIAVALYVIPAFPAWYVINASFHHVDEIPPAQSIIYIYVAGFKILVLSLLHLHLAVGCLCKLKFARKVSEFAFMSMVACYPFGSCWSVVGVFLAMFLFLPATIWKAPEDAR